MTSSCCSIELRLHDLHFNCLLLNNLDGVDRASFLDDWSRCRVRIAADGALALLKIIAIEYKIPLQSLYPHYLVGDLDSINESELGIFQQAGGMVIRDNNQDTTDFEKCLHLYTQLPVSSDEWLLVYGAMGGIRLDHAMAALQPLFANANVRVKLIQGPAHAMVIPVGDTIMHIHDETLLRMKCGLFPIIGPTLVTTNGLKWNLNNTSLEYGKMVSVSNEIIASSIMISTERPLLFTIQHPVDEQQ